MAVDVRLNVDHRVAVPGARCRQRGAVLIDTGYLVTVRRQQPGVSPWTATQIGDHAITRPRQLSREERDLGGGLIFGDRIQEHSVPRGRERVARHDVTFLRTRLRQQLRYDKGTIEFVEIGELRI